jgi:hypothetical protein
MIRVEFTNSPAGAWAHEITTNAEWTRTLAKYGVPVIGRIAVSGVDRGMLETLHTTGNATFIFRETEEIGTTLKYKQTHTGKGYTVYMSGPHLAKHEEDEEL